MSATRSYALSAAFTATSPISRRVALFCGRGATAAGTVVAAGKQQESQSSKRCCRLPRAAAACSAKTPGHKTATHIHRAERVLQRVSNRKAAGPQVHHPRGVVAQRQAGQQAGDCHVTEACKQVGEFKLRLRLGRDLQHAHLPQPELSAAHKAHQSVSNKPNQLGSPSREKGKLAASPMEPGMRGNSRRMGPVTTSVWAGERQREWSAGATLQRSLCWHDQACGLPGCRTNHAVPTVSLCSLLSSARGAADARLLPTELSTAQRAGTQHRAARQRSMQSPSTG